ncbi:hypothetical protein AB5J72_06215 [Streptomyces sp. CG1]|uniref:hypothetical protein n=1 Tax=Streptomyces sp. CG1 TaxID=1287523 RepID=UPI0034E25F38
MIWLAMPTPGHRITANNISRNFRACLFTDQRNVQTAQPVWTGMQAAARTTPVNAQRIVAPNGTTNDLLPYANSLVQRKCGLILAIGADLHDTVRTAAQHNPHQHFLYTGKPIPLSNVQQLGKPTADTAKSLVTAQAQKQQRMSSPAPSTKP